MSTLADRLRTRGIQDPTGFLAWAQPAAWAQAAGYRAPLEGLDGLNLNAVAKKLREAGAAQVCGVTLARQPWGT